MSDEVDATTYEGGGGDDSRLLGLKAVGLDFEFAEPTTPEAN